MPRNRVLAADTGLPAETLLEIYDCLILALDATDGNQPKRWQMPEARSYLRSALRDTRRLLGEVSA
ncbi:hypothetical protein [Salipiger sp. PrR003]|uniref:hypothetical protein n=1 Tax=Salipiger sp. PrR003 TaxID=2706776 RepID=UPI0013DC7838|nr:hypothetical protein [Salipiger sp. PrR003]NDV53928.1 hypothetical protein [Salipiger sp. PrR003]